MGTLCNACTAFQAWDLPREDRWNGARFAHHPSATALRAAAAGGCHLCTLLERALDTQARRPKGEQGLPDRQIWLSCCEPDFSEPITRIKVHFEPVSLAAAGSRELAEDGRGNAPDLVRISGVEVDDSLREVFELSMFSMVSFKGRDRYFYRNVEIENADLFFALVAPYYQAHVELAPLPDHVTRVLDECSKHEDNNTGSAASFELIKGWLGNCLANHPACQQFAEDNPPLPSRVLDVGDSSSAKQYLLVTTPGQRGLYAALSHRWGLAKPLTTVKDTLKTWQEGIDESEMSQTFRDAIKITRELGLRYLWIDSLCIIQDSAEDWAAESAKMASVYRQARVTIAAVDAEDEKAGCFSDRNGLQSRPCKLDLDVAESIFRREGTIHAFIGQGKMGDIWRPRGPLDSRAWVLQEQLLSSRILNFRKEGVYWECLTTDASERIPEGVAESGQGQRAKDADYVQIFKQGIAGLLDLTDAANRANFHRAWLLIVQAYSRRSLTKQTDKIAALFGVVKEIERVTKDRFLLGLWQGDFVKDLLWCVYGPGCPTVGPLKGYAGRRGPAGENTVGISPPSWSWVGVNGRIRYVESDLDKGTTGEIVCDLKVGVREFDSAELAAGGKLEGILVLGGYMKKGLPILCENSESKKLKYQPGPGLNAFSTGELAAALPGPSSSEEPGPLLSKPEDAENAMTWSEAMDWFREVSRVDPWIKKSTDKDDEQGVEVSSYALDSMLRQQLADQQVSSYHADFMDEVEEDAETAQSEFLLFNLACNHSGYWAPDIPGILPTVTQQQLLSKEERTEPLQLIAIHFVAVSRRDGYVWCLGLLPINGRPGHYLRLGLGWWFEEAWDALPSEFVEYVVV